MYVQLLIYILCIFNVFIVNGDDVFAINDGYRGLIDKIEAISVESREEVVERWIEQDLDHFDINNTRTWKMRYYEKLDYWKSNGPIFLFINGEAAATSSFLQSGMLYELAKETEGAMFLSEHRYYGKSQPVNRSIFNVQDLKFLSAEQALADNAELLKAIRDNSLYQNSKVVVIGGSYAGNLAAWMKLLYPDLVDAAVSSSGPVLAKRDFYEYYEVIGNDYEKYGTSDCVEKIKRIFLRYELLFETEDGIEQLKKEHNICETTNMTRPENKQLFFMIMTYNFIINTQYGSVDNIRNHCLKLTSTENALLQPDVQFLWKSDKTCYKYDFDDMIQLYHEADNDDLLCWTYQTCTEFGYFQSTDSNFQPFTRNLPPEWYDKFCTGLFGASFDKDRVNKGVKKINEMFGGKSPFVSKVVFVNGELDPWHSLGITKDGPLDNLVVYIPLSSHCKDLLPNEDDDNEEIKQARLLIKNQIKHWIGAGDNVPSIAN